MFARRLFAIRVFPRRLFPSHSSLAGLLIPDTPSVSVSPLSLTSFQADITGDAGVTQRLYYRELAPEGVWTQATTRVGNGPITVTGLNNSAAYQGFVISDFGAGYSLPAYFTVTLSQPDTVIASVLRKFNSSTSLLSLVPTGLWNTEVPEGTDLPYSFALLLSTRYRHQFEHKRVEQARVAIYTFARGAHEASTIAGQIQREFDWATDFTFSDESGVYFMKCQPQTFRLESAMARWKDGSLVYQSEVGYEIWVAR